MSGTRPEPGERRATSADVARESGVSRATVSYVLNNTPNVRISDATRRLVIDAAERLGHVPNPLARALKLGSDIVLCLVPALTLGFVFDHALDRLTSALAERGYVLLVNRLTPSMGDGSMPGLWRQVTPRLIVVIGGLSPRDVAPLTTRAPAPVVTDFGIVQHQRIGRMQAEYLIERGHSRLGFAMPADPALQRYAEQRLSGVREACSAAGLPEPDVAVVDNSLASHVSAVSGWRQAGVVTAVCAHNDDVALLLLDALRSLNLTAPTDLAVIGSDDVPHAQAELTTVALNLDVCASLLVAHVLEALGEQAGPAPTRDMLEIVERASA